MTRKAVGEGATTKKGSATSRTRSRGKSDTRRELLLAAERVFATRGIASATIKEINKEAGQRNESAIHYHFGSRDAIIEALIEMRTTPINALREQMLREARERANGKPLDSKTIVRCTLMPLVRMAFNEEGPHYYVRFLAQLRLDSAAWRKFSGRSHDSGLIGCVNALLEAKPFIPPPIIRQRFRLMFYMHLTALAALEQSQAEKGNRSYSPEFEVRVEELVTAAAAIFDAPLSPETLVAIRAAREAGVPGYEVPGVPL